MAYINQAGQVVNGQRDYNRLWTVQGPCYYPAGHIWFYYPLYVLSSMTIHAEHIIKIIHFLLGSSCFYFYSQIAFKYFKRDQMKA